ncbi:hypothetical protein Syun_008293 [Stephania yunnanensis]|uniref:SWIRM domain-containing protein n=1 Tax=Stephania yunnanensis TaxID=152371 RepID=A0AAP0KEE1_9MAGN
MMERTVRDGNACKRSSRRVSGVRNYNENLMDELIEKHLGSSPRKRNRTVKDLEKETEKEAMIALSLGFPIDELLDEEVRFGVVSELGGKEQNDYIVVRNHVLAKWRDNVRTWLSKDHIKETVSSEYENLISSAYDFLSDHGYINFGVSPSIKSQIPEATEGSVIVVGAGLAGLAAARQLLSFGFKVIVLEGRKRPGGRVYTQKMNMNGKFTAADLGGSVITGCHANPLGVLARQLSIPLHKVRDECPLFQPDGSLVDKDLDSTVELVFNKLLDRTTELRKEMRESANDISLGLAMETIRRFYVAYWDQDDPYEMGGDHCFLAGGNWRLIKAMCEDIPIFYGKTVDTIRYGDGGVEAISGNQVFRADMVLCTVALGVLKNKSIRFEPELPKRKLDAIERLGFGLLNKVAMVFPYVFWGENLDTFGCLNSGTHKRGEFFLFYSYHTVSGAPLLIALVAGEAARTFESADPAVILHSVLHILRDIFGPKGVDVPDPIQSICTRWGSDPLCYGSYSHVRVGSSGNDYDTLAESVGSRLFFAGEATNRRYPATMHGAFLSGLREASCILQTARSLQNEHRTSIQKNIGSCNDLLADLFRKPDLAFGNFSVIFDTSKEEYQSICIMRVSFGRFWRKLGSDYNSGHVERHHEEFSKLPLLLYTIISQENLHELQQVNGGDATKLSFLYRNLGLRLTGPGGLGSLGSSLTVSIANARKCRRRPRLSAGKAVSWTGHATLP